MHLRIDAATSWYIKEPYFSGFLRRSTNVHELDVAILPSKLRWDKSSSIHLLRPCTESIRRREEMCGREIRSRGVSA